MKINQEQRQIIRIEMGFSHGNIKKKMAEIKVTMIDTVLVYPFCYSRQLSNNSQFQVVGGRAMNPGCTQVFQTAGLSKFFGYQKR